MKRALFALFAATALSVPLTGSVAAQVEIPDPLGFRWMSVAANTAEGTTDSVVLSGSGWVIDGEVTANGSYNHGAGGDTPADLVSYGTWQADSLVSLEIIGIHGGLAAGTIVMEVTLFPVDGEPVPATLTMNCNIPPADMFTGLPEGFILEVGDTTFEPILLPVVEGAGPPEIAIGATTFTILEAPPA